MKHQTLIRIMILLVLGLGNAGCFSSNRKNIEAFLKPYQADVTSEDYVLQPPDEIEILCAKVAELHMQRQIIRPDGRISFEALGEIEVAGKTIGQVADILNKKAQQLYSLPGDKPIDVRLIRNESKVYYILGEVAVPGTRVYTGRDTLLSALADARPSVTGWTERIQVIRPSAKKNVKPKVFEINFDNMIVHGDLTKNVLLQEGDIVYVPPTPLASIAMVIEEFARPIGRALAPVVSVTQITGP